MSDRCCCVCVEVAVRAERAPKSLCAQRGLIIALTWSKQMREAKLRTVKSQNQFQTIDQFKVKLVFRAAEDCAKQKELSLLD